MEIFFLDKIDLILLSVLGGLFLIQSFYYIFLYNKVNRYSKALQKGKISFTEEQPPLSVILYSDNDSENLRKNLPVLLEQDYPLFEVIVISDGVTIESEEVLAAMERNYPNFYHTFVPEGSRYVSRRKLGLTMGIKASKYDWLVFTESDCRPVGRDWLKTMARNFTPETSIVLGCSGYKDKKGLRNWRISFYNLFTSLRYLGYALLQKTYMGVGRNMAYRKELFFNNKGYSGYLNIQRGEDDLFVNEVSTPSNTRVEIAKEAQIEICPESVSRHWKESRINYMFTSRFYKKSQKYWLGLESFTKFLFYSLFITLLVKSAIAMNWFVLGMVIVLFLSRFIYQLLIINKSATIFNEKKYYASLPLFDFIFPFNSLKYKLICRFRNKKEFNCK